MARRILLTGAGGYLGRFLVQELSGDYELVALSRRKELEGLPDVEVLNYNESDYRDLSALVESAEPDCIVHTAAISSAGQCEKDVPEAFLVNGVFTEALAGAARELSLRIIYTSTDLVFDGLGAPSGGFTPDMEPKPLSAYARSKYQGEQAIHMAPLGVIARLSLLYGPHLGDKRGPLGWMVDSFQAGEKVGLFEDEWRTPLYVVDACRFIRAIIEHQTPTMLYHISGPERLNRVRFGELLANRFGFDCSLINKGRRSDGAHSPPRPEDVSLDNSASVADLAVQPLSVQDALADFDL